LRPGTTALLFLLLAGAGPSRGDEQELPIRNQALLLFRVLSYDRNLAQRAHSSVTIAVAWRTGDEVLRDEAIDSLRAVGSQFKIAGLPVRAVPVHFERGEFSRQLVATGANVVLVVGSLVADARELSNTFRELHLLSASSSLGSADEGLTIGISTRGRRAAVRVNVQAGHAAGADFDSTLFTVAEMVGAPSTVRP
jgi:hypothetical protein